MKEKQEDKDNRFEQMINAVNALRIGDKELTAEHLEPGPIDFLNQFFANLNDEKKKELFAETESVIVRGELAIHFNYGGAATRLGLGGMYFVEIKDIAKFLLGKESGLSQQQRESSWKKLVSYFEELKEKEIGAQEKKGKKLTKQQVQEIIRTEEAKFYSRLKEAYQELSLGESLGMGPIQLKNYNIALRRFARERSLDQEKIIASTPIIIHLNDEIFSNVIEDLKQNNFYEFKKENIYILSDTVFRGYELNSNYSLVFDSKSKLLPPGHGYALEQFNRQNQVYVFEQDNICRLKPNLLELLLNRENTVKYIRTQRINDLTLWTSEALSIERLAYFIQKVKEGAQIGIELVGNPESQKGGSFLRIKGTKRNFLAEKLALLSENLSPILERAGQEKFPYNAFRNYYTVEGLINILNNNNLPRYLKYRGGRFYTEIVTGDITMLPEANTVAFMVNEDELIHDLKEFKNLPEGLNFLSNWQKELIKEEQFEEELARKKDIKALIEKLKDYQLSKKTEIKKEETKLHTL